VTMKPAAIEPQLLHVDEAARVLQIGRTKAYAMVSDGTFPGLVRIGRSVRVNRRALDRWIEEHTAPLTAA
jgi:excisionase family DNA binding protein